tara:strand:+ start:1082 stop:1447 length:366 start_codon:yes stop_codon:yes gene_type:complete
LVFKLNKERSLKSKAEIDRVFNFGKKVTNKYLSIYFLNDQHSLEHQKKVAVVVGKKMHALAVTRNKIKRLVRDCLRQSDEFEKFKSGSFIIMYHLKEIPTLSLLQENIKTLFLSLSKKDLL